MKKRIGMLLLAASLILGSTAQPANAATKTTQKKATTNKSVKTVVIADEENPLAGIENVASYQSFIGNAQDLINTTITKTVDTTVENEQNKLTYTEEELMYMTCIIYCEAGDQSFEGMVAVANVIQNRVANTMFDHVTTIKEAIYDCNRWGRQFSPVYVKKNGKWTTSGSKYESVLAMYKTGDFSRDWQQGQMEDCQKAAIAALTGERVIPENYLYFNMGISSTKAKCNRNGSAYTVIGCHIFY